MNFNNSFGLFVQFWLNKIKSVFFIIHILHSGILTYISKCKYYIKSFKKVAKNCDKVFMLNMPSTDKSSYKCVVKTVIHSWKVLQQNSTSFNFGRHYNSFNLKSDIHLSRAA